MGLKQQVVLVLLFLQVYSPFKLYFHLSNSTIVQEQLKIHCWSWQVFSSKTFSCPKKLSVSIVHKSYFVRNLQHKRTISYRKNAVGCTSGYYEERWTWVSSSFILLKLQSSNFYVMLIHIFSVAFTEYQLVGLDNVACEI